MAECLRVTKMEVKERASRLGLDTGKITKKDLVGEYTFKLVGNVIPGGLPEK